MAVIHDFGGESIKLTPEAERLTAATARAQAKWKSNWWAPLNGDADGKLIFGRELQSQRYPKSSEWFHMPGTKILHERSHLLKISWDHLIEEIQEIKIHYNTWLVHIIYWLHRLYLSKVSWFLSRLTPKSFLFKRRFLGQMREFSPVNHSILLMEGILHQLIWQISHHLQGFIDVGWCRISSINSITTSESLRKNSTQHWDRWLNEPRRKLQVGPVAWELVADLFIPEKKTKTSEVRTNCNCKYLALKRVIFSIERIYHFDSFRNQYCWYPSRISWYEMVWILYHFQPKQTVELGELPTESCNPLHWEIKPCPPIGMH